MKLKAIALVVAAFAATTASAEDKPWEVTSELGAIITSGNTETTSIKGGIAAKQNLENWKNEYKLSGFYKENEVEVNGVKKDQRTNEKYTASAQGNYKLDEKHSYLFVYGGHTSDYFGAFRNESVISVGYGRRLLDESDMTLDAEIGPGYKYFKYQDYSTEVDKNGTPLAGKYEGEMIALAKANFAWQVSEAAKFTQLVAVEYGSSNTKTRSESALLTKINDSLQMKVGFNITHNSDVGEGQENTDTETALTLVYSF